MTAESAGCPYVKVPVPIQDTYSVAEIAILLRVSRNAVYEWSLFKWNKHHATWLIVAKAKALVYLALPSKGWLSSRSTRWF